jgi:hypothetical protein
MLCEPHASSNKNNQIVHIVNFCRVMADVKRQSGRRGGLPVGGTKVLGGEELRRAVGVNRLGFPVVLAARELGAY